MLCFALTADAWVSALRGELGRARSAGAEAMALLDGLDESVLSRATRVHVAAAQLEAGEPEGCLAAMSAGGAPEFAGVEPGRRAWLYAILARAELALGRPAAAAEWVRAARRPPPASASRTPRPPCCARARSSTTTPRRAGDARRRDGAPLDALAAALRAAELADSVGAVIQAGAGAHPRRARRRRRGRRAAARAGRGRARQLRRGAAARRGRARAAPARREDRRAAAARRPAAKGSPACPGREREVADLVALGPHQQGDRGRAVPVGEDRREPHEPAVRQARRALARGGRRGRRPRARRRSFARRMWTLRGWRGAGHRAGRAAARGRRCSASGPSTCWRCSGRRRSCRC